MPFQKKQKKNLFREALLRKEKPIVSRREVKRDGFFSWPSPMLVLLWIVFIAALVYAAFFSPWLVARDIRVEGQSVIPNDELVSFISHEIEGKYGHVLSRRNLFLVPLRSLRRDLLAAYPKFESVSVRRVFPESLVVAVTEKPYLVRWCSGGPCYLVGSGGEMLPEDRAQNPLYADSILSLIDRSAQPVSFGETVDLANYVETAVFLEKNVPEKTGVKLGPDAETPTRFADELRFTTDGNWTLLVNTDVPPEETLATLVPLLATTISEDKKKDLLSIDLRISGRAFIGYRSAMEEVATSLGDTDAAEKKTDKESKKK